MQTFTSDDITPNTYQTCSGKAEMWVEGITQTQGSCREIHFDRVKQLVQSHKRNLDNDHVLLGDPRMSVFMLVAVLSFPKPGSVIGSHFFGSSLEPNKPALFLWGNKWQFTFC